ncbi:MAG: F0F1 ATP synthase subunit delta [Kiloniellales bacterium]|nr:F0F1 ATP synthase subunit delta [Kiloniellales bacterium]
MAGETTSESGLAGRYASALFELADGAKQLDTVADELRAFNKLIDESEALRTLIRSPLYDRDEQAKAMGAILDKAGISDLSRRFVLVVAGNRRLFALPAMIDAYLRELARRRGEVTAHVTAARELTKEQETALSAALKKIVGGKVEVDLKVDPALIGGLVVRVGSRMMDSSLRTKLEKLQFAMKGVG